MLDESGSLAFYNNVHLNLRRSAKGEDWITSPEVQPSDIFGALVRDRFEELMEDEVQRTGK